MTSLMLQYKNRATGAITNYVFEAHSPERAAHIISESMQTGSADFELVGVATA